MSETLEVHPYSIELLREVISSNTCITNSKDTISSKAHDNYLQSYCKDIGVTTLIVEKNYIDHDYLEDYASYYVRCFSDDYKRKCIRVHFFSNVFTNDELHSCLSCCSDNQHFHSELSNGYLGFIVIKPLPLTVIGRTCLATYDSTEENGRSYPVVRDYKVSICGIDLRVRSLAFQEQDSTVAACATSALWSIFQGTGKKFQHTIPSPIEITKAATDKFPYDSRALPNDGLSSEMIAQGIRHVGLEPFTIKVDEFWLKANLYAYLRGEIPLMLGIRLFDTEPKKNESMGLHALAVTGYRIESNKPPPTYDNYNTKLTSSRIDRIYAHDDQVGPFARMCFTSPITVTNGKTSSVYETLTTSWINKNGSKDKVLASPVMITLPLYKKIRIPFSAIYNKTQSFDYFLNHIFEDDVFVNNKFINKLGIEWDIYLTTNNEYKAELYKSSDGENCYTNVLLTPLPRYIWRATSYLDGTKLFDLIYDATDVKNGVCFVLFVTYDKSLFNDLCAISNDTDAEAVAVQLGSAHIIEWFKKQATLK